MGSFYTVSSILWEPSLYPSDPQHVVLVLGVVAMGVVAMAAAPDTLYFKPGEWTTDSARIAAYVFERYDPR